MLCKPMDWFLYDRDLRHERVKLQILEELCKNGSHISVEAPTYPSRTLTSVCQEHQSSKRFAAEAWLSRILPNI